MLSSMFFFVAVFLYSSNIVAGRCNDTKPFFPTSEGEIHAMLARDQYVEYIKASDGFIPVKFEAIRKIKGAVHITYGNVKEMIVHLSSTKEANGNLDARIFLTSYGTVMIKREVSNNGQDGVKYREAFLRFRLFGDGYQVDEYYIPEEGEPIIVDGKSGDCHGYKEPMPFYPIQSLLIQIDCETTIVKKILVKCYPERPMYG